MQKFKYDVSIVIPVYNVEDYLKECLESILRQNYDINKIEIILIDDGSIDNSLNICKKYAEKYKNIKLLTQPNSGVSKARNNGIKNSKGKYIMLLDSDDTISKSAVKNLFNFFEQHYNEIDIVTYPIKFNRHGKISKNIRYDAYDKGTNIYDINEYIYLNQSTVNIMIKNEFEKTNLYNENMKLSEDQNFDTEMIMKKEKIGYVNEAIYYYRKYDASVSASKNNPYYCFDNIMSYNEMLLKQYKKDDIIPKYVQSLVINTIKWRIKTDELFPYYLEGEEFEKSVNRIRNIIKKIDVDVIMNVSDMNFYHKIYLLKFSEHKIETKVEGKINLYCDGILINSFNSVDGLISRFKLKNNKLYLMGDLLSPIFEDKNLDLYLEKIFKDGKKEIVKIDLNISNESYYQSMFKITTSYGFDISFNINDIKKFKIYLKDKDKKINIEFKFKKFAPNNFITGKINALYSRKSLCFKIRKKTISNLLRSRIRKGLKCFSKNRKACIYRFIYYFYRTKKNIWLYTDRGDALDNAYEQFIHDFNKNDNVNRYYVSRFSEKEINKYFTIEQKKYLIRQGSLKHKMLYLKSNKIITSFIDLQVYCPFNKSVTYYNDLTHYELVYLQHGILHANLLKMYGKEFTEIDKFVISTNFEKDNLTKKYNYKLEDLILSGMPRMNLNLDKNNIKNKILFAPSWRKYLIGNLVNNKRKLKKNDFINSKFYKEIYEFLHSKELNKFLEKNKFILEFKLHPIFKEYSELFEIKNNKYIDINFNKTDVTEYKIFITDFSSFQFDFVKLERPIIYFMPDMKEFKSGLHTYRKLDLKYEDAFGKLCLQSNEVLKEIERIVKNNCKVDKKYKDRMNKFFLKLKNPCDDIYDELRELKNN